MLVPSLASSLSESLRTICFSVYRRNLKSVKHVAEELLFGLSKYWLAKNFE